MHLEGHWASQDRSVKYIVFHSFSMVQLVLYLLCQLASHTSEPGRQVASSSRLSASCMTLNDQHACYPLWPHESMTWATFRRRMSTPNITQHTLPSLTVLHQTSPEWSRMGSCQTRCLLPILINPDPTVYGSCSFSGKQWKTMEDII